MRKCSIWTVSLLLSLPSLAWAQAAEGDPPPEDAPAEGESKPEAAPAEEPAEKPAEAPSDKPADKPAEKSSGEAESSGAGSVSAADYGVQEGGAGASMKWAANREVRVIQKREVLKEGRHQFSLIGGVVPNDDFFAYVDAGAAYDYYFSEDIAIEVRGAYTFPQQTSLEATLEKQREQGGPGLEVRLPETLRAHASLSAVWNLLHGKIGFFNTRLTEFDLGLNFGVGSVMTNLTAKGGAQAPRFAPQGNIGAVLQFYLGSRFVLRVDYRQFFYQANGGGVSFPISTTVGLSYLTAPIE